LSQEHQDWVINGDPDYGIDANHEWPKAWYGIKGYFRWLESKSYKMHVRVLLSRYRSYRTCTDCNGTRFRPDTLLDWMRGNDGRSLSLPEFYQLSLREALSFVESLIAGRHDARTSDPLTLALQEVRTRLAFLNEVGLGYLTLDRPTRTLSGGETERVNLTTCLGASLTNTLFVLDEPTVGLHPRDVGKLIGVMQRLRDLGNTLVVVEHEEAVIRAADHLVDIGPGRGEGGGHLVFAGPGMATQKEAAKAGRAHPSSLTLQYLSGKLSIPVPAKRRRPEKWITLTRAAQ